MFWFYSYPESDIVKSHLNLSFINYKFRNLLF